MKAAGPGESPQPRALGTTAHDTPLGGAQVRRFERTAGARHGTVEPSRARDVASSVLAELALDETLAGLDVRRALFLDTETTGLAHGAGTLPFLIGLSWFEGSTLVGFQLLLERPGDEAPLLWLLRERLEAASFLVTYNGKSFDWPLLRTRFVLNRLGAPRPLPHLDLLHCARRLFKRRLGAVRLVHLEAHVLGLVRQGDVDGAEIPERYFRWLRTGNGALLRGVLEHNELDLCSLPALVAALGERYLAEPKDEHPLEALDLAYLALRAQRLERALGFARAASRAQDKGLAAEALALCAQLSLRHKDYAGAAEALERALALVGAHHARAAPLHFKLAKLYEHRLGALPKALAHAERARGAEPELARAVRLDRLARRLGRGEVVLAPVE